jgi:high-affinity nickel-transport protein
MRAVDPSCESEPASSPSGRPADEGLRRRLGAIGLTLAALNLGAWAWAIWAFRDRPTLLGVALVVYGLGLRHAVDGDHIAAIDNVTRKLMQAGQRPVGVGFFFAVGHASIVILVTAAVAAAAALLGTLRQWQAIGGLLSTGVSSLFLLAVAVMNIAIFVSVYRSWRRLRAGLPYHQDDLDILLGARGPLSRLLRPLFKVVDRSWHMLALGLLFGLGFDTATEVAVFGVSAAQAAKDMPLATVLVFPLLFAAGMALVDSGDGLMMLGAYDWAFMKPARKLYYNMVITLVSVAVALLIGGAEALDLARQVFAPSGAFWDAVGATAGDMNLLGMATIGLFVTAWAASLAIYRLWRLDEAPAVERARI